MKSLREKIRKCLFRIGRREAFEEELLPRVKFRYYGGVPYLTWDVRENLLGYVTTRARVRELTVDGVVSILQDTARFLQEETSLVRKFGYEARGCGLYWKRLDSSSGTDNESPVVTGLRMVIHHSSLEREERSSSIEITRIGVEDDRTVHGVLKGVSDETDLLLKTEYIDLLQTLVAFEKERLDMESITRLPPEGRDLIMKMSAKA